MLDRDILRRGERREIHARIPVEQHFIIDRKLPDLLRRQRDARLVRARRQDLLKRRHTAPFLLSAANQQH